jgi:predicted 3-demethylubiquinone-9 3-methyltransferase (glyoxalase superfamily)
MTKPRKQRAFYTSVFNNSMVLKPRVMAKPARRVSGRPKGSVMTVTFQLDGQEFVALNGGPQFHFTEAVSFVVDWQTQEEVDRYWQRLSEGGQETQCG